jgi:hypothetical protein
MLRRDGASREIYVDGSRCTRRQMRASLRTARGRVILAISTRGPRTDAHSLLPGWLLSHRRSQSRQVSVSRCVSAHSSHSRGCTVHDDAIACMGRGAATALAPALTSCSIAGHSAVGCGRGLLAVDADRLEPGAGAGLAAFAEDVRRGCGCGAFAPLAPLHGRPLAAGWHRGAAGPGWWLVLVAGGLRLVRDVFVLMCRAPCAPVYCVQSYSLCVCVV